MGARRDRSVVWEGYQRINRLWQCGATLSLLLCGTALTAAAQVSVLTQHNDNARTGQNTNETLLTPTNVTFSQFGKLFSQSVDGQLYAQPLYVSNLTIPGLGTHNVVFVATQAGSVYAFDADTNTGANANPLWKASLLDVAHGAASGAKPVTGTQIGCDEIVPNVSITSTPVIDAGAGAGTMYVVAKSFETGVYVYRLHAIDITTGAERPSGPVTIAPTVAGTGDGSMGGQIAFNTLQQLNRAGLLLSGGTVYAAFASGCDIGPYHGWIVGYDASNLAPRGVLNTTVNGGLGGIWMSGAGLAADDAGNIYVPTGNGTFDTSHAFATQWGDTLMKLSLSGGNLSVTDYFTPFDQSSLNSADRDLGSGGVVLLPDQPGSHPHLLVQGSKGGTIYVLDRDQLTANNLHYCVTSCNNSDPQIVQEFIAGIGGAFSVPAYWNGRVYIWGRSDFLKAYTLTNGLLSASPSSKSSNSLGFPAASPVVSANGTTNGIVWAIDGTQNANGPAVLYAYDATDLSKQLYNSTQASMNRDRAGNGIKFSVPIVANGKVYVGTSTEVDVYGLLNGGVQQAATPMFSPAAGAYTDTQVSVTLSDTTPGNTIYYTTDGSNPTTTSNVYGSAILVTSSPTTIKAMATASGYTNSPIASATYTLVSGNTLTMGRTTVGASTDSGDSNYINLVRVVAGAQGGTAASCSVSVGAVGTSPANQWQCALYADNNGSVGTLIASSASGTLTANSWNTVAFNATIVANTAYWIGYNSNGGSTVNNFKYSNVTGTVFRYQSQTYGTWPASPSTSGPLTTQPSLYVTYNVGPAQAATPTFNPVGGTYTGTQVSVTLSDTTPGNTIYYTTDGNDPTTSSNVYSSAILVTSSPTTIKAMATASGYTNSVIASATYNLVLPQAATPTFNPVGGTYTGTQVSVTLSDTTPGNAIYYTTDGSNPTTTSNVYGSAILVTSSPTTIKAMATASGYTNSPIASATYTLVSGNTLTMGRTTVGASTDSGDSNYINLVRVVAGAQGGTAASCSVSVGAVGTSPANQWQCALYADNNGSVGTLIASSASGTLTANSWNTVAFNATIVANTAYWIGYNSNGGSTVNNFKYSNVTGTVFRYQSQTYGTWPASPSTSGPLTTQPSLYVTYNVGPAQAATPTFNPVGGTYTGTQVSVTLSDTTPGNTIYYTTDGNDPTTSSNVYSSAILVTSSPTTIKAMATASGYTNSVIASATYNLVLPQAATPTFNPVGGTYTGTQVSVTLSDTTPGNAIYYTTDGSNPTTTSNVYGSAILVTSSPTTIKAMATASGYTNSPIASATYTLVSGNTLTMGRTTVGASTDSGDSNYINLVRVVAGAQGGTAASCSVSVGAVGTSPANQWQCALYADNNGSVGTLIASSASGTLTANSWNTVAFNATIVANTAYWIGYNSNGGSTVNNFKYSNVTGTVFRYQSQTYGTWPASPSTSGPLTMQPSLYITYNVGP